MKKFLFIFCLLYVNIACAQMCGPAVNVSTKCEWETDGSVPIKYLGYGVIPGADRWTYLPCDDGLWMGANVVTQAACTNQNGWASHDMDIAAVAPGSACWQRRTHARGRDGVLSQDTGPWQLASVYDTQEECLNYCGNWSVNPNQPLYALMCEKGLRHVFMLPQY